MKNIIIACLAVAGIVSSNELRAAAITWGTPQAISGDSNVATVGTLHTAINFGHPAVGATTVNGVTFAPFGVTSGGTSSPATMGNVDIRPTAGGFNMFGTDLLGSNFHPFAALSPEYRALLSTGVSDVSDANLRLEVSGLTIGRTYLFQGFVNASGPTFSFMDTSMDNNQNAGDGGRVAVIGRTSIAEGAVGQWVTGTFVADGTTFQNIF